MIWWALEGEHFWIIGQLIRRGAIPDGESLLKAITMGQTALVDTMRRAMQ